MKRPSVSEYESNNVAIVFDVLKVRENTSYTLRVLAANNDDIAVEEANIDADSVYDYALYSRVVYIFKFF